MQDESEDALMGGHFDDGRTRHLLSPLGIDDPPPQLAIDSGLRSQVRACSRVVRDRWPMAPADEWIEIQQTLTRKAQHGDDRAFIKLIRHDPRVLGSQFAAWKVLFLKCVAMSRTAICSRASYENLHRPPWERMPARMAVDRLALAPRVLDATGRSVGYQHVKAPRLAINRRMRDALRDAAGQLRWPWTDEDPNAWIQRNRELARELLSCDIVNVATADERLGEATSATEDDPLAAAIATEDDLFAAARVADDRRHAALCKLLRRDPRCIAEPLVVSRILREKYITIACYEDRLEPRSRFRPQEDFGTRYGQRPSLKDMAEHARSPLRDIRRAIEFTVGKTRRPLRQDGDVRWARQTLRSIGAAIEYSIGHGSVGWRALDTVEYSREATWRRVLDARSQLEGGAKPKAVAVDTGLGEEYVQSLSADVPLRELVEAAFAGRWGIDVETARQIGRPRRLRRSPPTKLK